MLTLLLIAMLLICTIEASKLSRQLSKASKHFVHALVVSSLLPLTVISPQSVHAIEQQYKLPPIDRKDSNRCVLVSSNIGQANAARDKLYDLRECDLRAASGAGKDLSGAIMADADFSGVDFKEAQLSKAYARNSKFIGVDFTNAILDRVSFDFSDMTGSVFKNAG